MNTQHDTAEQEDRDRARHSHRVAILVGGILPVVIALVAGGIMISWIPELPALVATHWSGTGEPDGFGSVWVTILLPVIFALGFGAIAVGSAWRTASSGLPRAGQKALLATNMFLSGFIGVLGTGTLAMQRGLADAGKAGSITPALLSALVVGLVLGVIGWLLLPRTDKALPSASEPRRLAVSASERVAWSSSVSIAPGVLAMLGAIVLVLIGTVVLSGTRAAGGAAIATAVAIVVVLLTAATSFWRVTADRRGFVVRSLLGWPRVVIRPGDIRSVHVVEINPVADFGGWGWRWVGGRRTGIIMRAGQAIEVTRNSGSSLVVTVGDAETGASVLAAVAAQTAKGRTPGS